MAKKTAEPITLADAARRIGCHRSVCTKWADRLGLGTRIGATRVITEAELRQLAGQIAVNRPGNPNMKKGNYFAGAKKRPRKRGKG